ncbi:MAG: nuclear transport factor 2 family protein [Actinomycetota bacterium]
METASRRDLEAMDELISEDLEFDSTFAASEGRVFRGHAGIRQYFVALEESFEDLRLDIEDLIDVGDERVVLLVRVSGRGKGSGVPVQHPYGQVWTLSGQTTRQIDSYADPAQALEAVGVRE